MLLFWGVDIARANAKNYERQLDKAEFKYIIKSINIASKHGFTGLKWEGAIRSANKKKLKELGYQIIDNYSKCEIIW